MGVQIEVDGDVQIISWSDYRIRSRQMEIFVNELGYSKRLTLKLAKLNRIWPIDLSSKDGQILVRYFTQTNAHNLNNEIVGIWSIHREEDERLYRDRHYDRCESMLLWHGSKNYNIAHILTTGLRRPERKEYRRSYFGRGVYFADRVSKSANYCDPNPYGVLFVSKVATGKRYNPREHGRAPNDFDSVMGVGTYIPDPNVYTHLDDALVPYGRTVLNPDDNIDSSSLKYNEYCVYTSRRVLIRYVVAFRRV